MLNEQPNVLTAELKGSTTWGGGLSQWTVLYMPDLALYWSQSLSPILTPPLSVISNLP